MVVFSRARSWSICSAVGGELSRSNFSIVWVVAFLVVAVVLQNVLASEDILKTLAFCSMMEVNGIA